MNRTYRMTQVKKKFLFRRGIKYPVRVQNHTKSATTIMVCGSAGGVLLPPYIVFKSGSLWESWTIGGPQGSPCCSDPCCSRGSRYNCTSHGWMDANTFKDWFFTTFLPHAKRLTGRKVLIGDNLASHFNADVIKECEDSQIDFVCLPKNSTHLTQPLDVCFFRPLKEAWRYCLNKWKNNNTRLNGIPKSTFPSLVRECLERINNVGCISDNLKSGFRATGIYPTDRHVILQKLPRKTNPNDINDTVTDYLKGQRFAKTDKIMRRKKINVAPGQSVTSALLGRTDSDDDSPDDVIQYADSESENEIVDTVPEYEKPNDTNLKIGSFLLVNILSGSRKKSKYVYVAIIQDISENNYTVNGLKSLDNTKQTFKLQINDVFSVGIEDIIAVLKMPSLTEKHHYKFSQPLTDVREF